MISIQKPGAFETIDAMVAITPSLFLAGAVPTSMNPRAGQQSDTTFVPLPTWHPDRRPATVFRPLPRPTEF